jgi:hypothetical protein
MIYPSSEIMIPEPIRLFADLSSNNLVSIFFLELILITEADAFEIALT